jgi:serine protease Do
MRRGIVVGLGIAVLAAGALAGSPRVQGAPQDKERTRRIEVLRRAGGGRLGVVIEEVGKDELGRLKLAEERGALVRRVEEGSPAAKAGIQKDDVILKYQGEDVRSATQLSRLVRETPAGRSVSLEVSRGGTTQHLTATVGEGGSRIRLGDLDIHTPLLPEPPEPPDAPEPPGVLRW